MIVQQYYSVNRVILSAENSGKPLGPEPRWGAHSVPQSPSWWRGELLPLLKNATPALGLRPFGLPPMKNPGHALLQHAVVLNQSSNSQTDRTVAGLTLTRSTANGQRC